MPNWCSTSYYITGEDKEMLLKFWMDFRVSGTKAEKIEARESWLGNIYLQAGYKMKDDDWKESWIQCRGWINSCDAVEEDGLLKGVVIDLETAWSPMDESFQRLLNEKYPGLKVLCRCEEPGCEIYYNSDDEHEYFEEKWHLETDDGVEEYYSYRHGDEDRLLKDIEELSGVKIRSVSDLDDGEVIDLIEKEFIAKRREKLKKEGDEVVEDEDDEYYYIKIHRYTSY